MTRIVGVHGVGNHRPGETPSQARKNLATTWRAHLRRGLPDVGAGGIDLDTAYYADHLHTPGRQGTAIGLDDLPADALEMVHAWLTELEFPTGTSHGPGTWPLRQVLAWIANRRRLSPRLVELFVATFFREVATYLRFPDGDARRAARDTVAATIREHRPAIVLAHSLGTVVTYEALWAHADLTVDLLITLGSPLALPHAVFPRLTPTPHLDRGTRPPGVARWVNLADPGDLVALPPKGISHRFRGVDLDDHAVIHAFDFHLAANYLACRQLADQIRSHLDGQT